MVYAEKLASEEKSDQPIWELTKPVPLNDDGSSVEETLGRSPDVHFIYICTKVINDSWCLCLLYVIGQIHVTCHCFE